MYHVPCHPWIELSTLACPGKMYVWISVHLETQRENIAVCIQATFKYVTLWVWESRIIILYSRAIRHPLVINAGSLSAALLLGPGYSLSA